MLIRAYEIRLAPGDQQADSEGMEEKVGEESVPLNQDACSQGEPDGSDHRCSGEDFFQR